MAALGTSKTLDNLKAAFAGESQANRRYLYFAQKADIEGHYDVAAVFRSTAEGEAGHAHGHLEYLEEVGDPATGLPIGGTVDNLKASVAGATHEYTDMTPPWLKQRATKASTRNPRQGREVPRRQVPEDAGHEAGRGLKLDCQEKSPLMSREVETRCAWLVRCAASLDFARDERV